ncbi:MAG: Holliday junction branch migration DNA helicase RuvB [Parcubacteria group bacterium QH_9_35_7]|nr:MAG: Holliday junction branch migration DNA helicase RuvB [Parcubacteria group bacterium QH_9_35_7]
MEDANITSENLNEERVVDPSKDENDEEENIVENKLRPEKIEHFIGQKNIKKPLSISIQAAEQRGEPIEHILLHGNPGLGKTTLAHIIANEMDVNIQVTAGPALDKVGDLAAILSNLQEADVLFIDEIHRMNKNVEEVLYSAMEDFAINIIVGEGPSARTLRMPLERFTLIGATTKMNLLSSPLRDRFGHTHHFDFYKDDAIQKIIKRNAEILGVEVHDEASKKIAVRSRRTPRVANRLLKRVRDYAQVKHDGIISTEVAEQALGMLNIDKKGLDEVDRKIIDTIIDNFNGGPVGLKTLSAAVAEEQNTLENIYEPYLLQIGMIKRTSRGRKATQIAYEHMDKGPQFN